MKIFLWILGVLAVFLAGALYWVGSPKGPSYEDVAHLAEPHLLEMGPQKVLQVTAVGEPDAVAGQAFGLLLSTYVRLEGVPMWGEDFKPPRARWPIGSNIPAQEWVGLYAMPVPASITELPPSDGEGGLTVELTTWEYGEVAEVLHVGDYDAEAPDIERLKAFIEAQGYEISGLHEEEYLKGPGWFFAGNRDSYLTLIRYPVRPRQEVQDDTADAGRLEGRQQS